MESLLGILVVGAAVMVPVAIVGGVIAWAVHLNKRRMERWRSVAQKLGLQFTARMVWGVLDGQSVHLRTETRGSGKNRQTWTVVAGTLAPPLDLGLAVYRQGFLSGFAQLFGAQDIAVGDPAFDPSFVLKADEPHRATALLAPELRQVLLSMLQGGVGFGLYDAGVQIERRGMIDDEAWLEWALRTAALVGRVTDEARRGVPPASPVAAHRVAWLEYAQAAGLAGMDTPLCIWGRLEGASVSAYSVRVAALQHWLEVLVRFDAPLALGLLVRPKGTLDGIASLLGGQDIRLGDPAFDEAFVVKCPRPDGLSAIIDPDVRRRMLELHSRGAVVQLRDDGVTVRAPQFPADPHEVPRWVADVKAIARAVWLSARRPEAMGEGPFR